MENKFQYQLQGGKWRSKELAEMLSVAVYRHLVEEGQSTSPRADSDREAAPNKQCKHPCFTKEYARLPA